MYTTIKRGHCERETMEGQEIHKPEESVISTSETSQREPRLDFGPTSGTRPFSANEREHENDQIRTESHPEAAVERANTAQ